MPLTDPSIKKLSSLIKDSFRVRRNQRPLYVELGGSLERIAAAQHQVIFGRRGSGKSCLLVHYLNSTAHSHILPIYVLADEFKKLTYPDILIRLLVEILESIPVPWVAFKRLFRRPVPTRAAASELRKLLDVADESEVVEDQQHRSSDTASVNVRAQGLGEAGIGSKTDQAQVRSSKFKERKIDTLERHLREYKNAIISALRTSGAERGCVLIDDFYLISREWHPDVVDYLHRLLRDTDVYLKIATIRHRTTLLRNRPQTVGVELGQDVEEVNLDRIHVVEPDTSAASGRSGRYEAYTLDFSLFMEPRRRNIEIVEFWRRGEDSHRLGIREAPVYGLDRAARVFEDVSSSASPEAFLDEQEDTGTTERLQVGDVPKGEQGVQGKLFDGDAKRGDS